MYDDTINDNQDPETALDRAHRADEEGGTDNSPPRGPVVGRRTVGVEKRKADALEDIADALRSIACTLYDSK